MKLTSKLYVLKGEKHYRQKVPGGGGKGLLGVVCATNILGRLWLGHRERVTLEHR